MRRWCIALVVAAAAATASPAAAQTARLARILVLYSHDEHAPSITEFSAQLHAAVREAAAPELVEFYGEPLDLERFPSPAHEPRLAEGLASKYGEVPLDVIVTEGSGALRFAIEQLSPLLPEVPIVYGFALEPIVNFDSLPDNVTGRRELLPFASTFEMARNLQPDATRLVIVGGRTAVLDTVLLEIALKQVTPLLNGIDLTVLDDWTYEQLYATLSGLPRETIVLVAYFRRDRDGVSLNPDDMMPSLSAASAAPVYAIVSSWVGRGVVGGEVVSVADSGRHTGALVARVLQRAPGERLPPAETGTTRLVADSGELRRWELPESALPSGTEILFRPPTLWERNRTLILLVPGALVVQSLLIALLLAERRRRVRAQAAVAEEAEHAQLLAELATDAARHGSANARWPLDDTLERVARFAAADTVLLEYAEAEYEAPAQVFWAEAANGAGGPELPSKPGEARLDIPLTDGEAQLGRLVLCRTGPEWPPNVAARLDAVADLIAGALSRARTARALEEVRAQVTHIARVATVGELTSALSRELRQPLTAIRAQAEAAVRFLTRDDPDFREVQEALQDIVREDVRVTQIIDNVQMLLRAPEQTREPLSLNGICRGVAQLLAPDAARRHATVELALASQLPPILGDEAELQQAVMNLTLNALDATAAQPPSDRKVVVGTAVRGTEVEVFVHDSGPGLPQRALDRLFKPFFSTKARGLGMGLAVVQAIVERHHGRVHAANDEAGGAIFRLILPIA